MENEEQLDKYLAVHQQTPTIQKVIVFDPEGLYEFNDDKVMLLEDLYERGREFNKDHGELWDQIINDIKPSDLVVMIYTSGTTGPPKGAMLSHINCLFQIESFNKILPVDNKDGHRLSSSLSHRRKVVSALLPLKSCGTISFAEGPDTVPENIGELSPTVFFAVPRIWRKALLVHAIAGKRCDTFMENGRSNWHFKLVIK